MASCLEEVKGSDRRVVDDDIDPTELSVPISEVEPGTRARSATYLWMDDGLGVERQRHGGDRWPSAGQGPGIRLGVNSEYG